MPYASRAQQRALHAKQPELAKQFDAEMSDEDWAQLPATAAEGRARKTVRKHLDKMKAADKDMPEPEDTMKNMSPEDMMKHGRMMMDEAKAVMAKAEAMMGKGGMGGGMKGM